MFLWGKKEKTYVEIERPEIVRLYNKSMGGVDKTDQLVSYYRIFIRSKKWTLRMAMHAIDIAISNCWIQYQRHSKILKTPKNKIMDLMHFRMELAEALIEINKSQTPRRRGRPSSQQLLIEEPKTTSKRKLVDSNEPRLEV